LANAKTKPQVGRPSSYTEETANRICEQLSLGRSLREICRADDMPGISTVMRWLGVKENESFRERYACARVIQADILFDEILTIADTPIVGVKTVTKGEATERTEADMLEHRRLQIDARKWIASKLAPKKYGEKLAHELTGADGGPIQTLQISDADRARALAAFIAKTKAGSGA
jgi:hypothetical protein